MYELCAESLGCRSIQRVDTPLVVSLLATLFITDGSLDSGELVFFICLTVLTHCTQRMVLILLRSL
jgi:hypothetical protein